MQLFVVDAGCLGEDFAEHPALIRGKVAQGTANLAKGPAMTGDRCLAALLLGVSLADRAAAEGVRVLGAPATWASATPRPPRPSTAPISGSPARDDRPGTGLAPEAVARKAGVVERGLAANAGAVASGDAFEILAALGGLEIACLAGLVLAGQEPPGGLRGTASSPRRPTPPPPTSARPCGTTACFPTPRPSRATPGRGRPGAQAVLDLGLRLGEGTGAAMTVFLLRCAADIYNDMASFADAGVSEG